MEDILARYTQAEDPQRPLVCMDEVPKQLISDVRDPIPAQAEHPKRLDYEYERHGVANLFMFFEPFTGQRHVKVTATRTRLDWAEAMRALSDEIHPEAEQIIVVLDNLNTHTPAAFYLAFEPEEARRLVKRFAFHFTPKHGSWLNMAEIELSVLARQCLNRRIPDEHTLGKETQAWVEDRNSKVVKVDWRFSTADARIKLKRLYPKFHD
jgi:transposase